MSALRDVTLGMPFVVGGLLWAVMTLLGSLFRVLTASDVKVPLGQNLETCLNPHQMVYGFIARSVSRSQSLLSSAPASRERAAALVSNFNGLIAVRPPESFFQSNCFCGRSPAPHGFFLCIHYLPIYFVT